MESISISDLQKALAKNEFELHYQPKVSMVTGELVGGEALIRWKREDGSFIQPNSFIPIAERTQFISEITLFVFKQLVIDATFINTINDNLKLSFNASGKDFYNDELTETMLKAIHARQIKADNLEIEVTETVLVDEKQAMDCLGKLSAVGISITMDDFGTGHSGLVELSKWPFDTLKIDQKFVASVYESQKDREILQASIRMAHQLSMDVVAEGIEDEATYRVLQEYGCKTAQGYWISRPIPLNDFVQFIQEFQNLPAMPIGLLYMAQLDHIQWKKNLIDTALFIHGSTEKRSIENLRGFPELDPTQCKLGTWYYSVGDQFELTEGYEELELPHRRLHETGKELLRLAETDCDMSEIIEYIKKLSKESIEVLGVLQTLENSLHIEQYQ